MPNIGHLLRYAVFKCCQWWNINIAYEIHRKALNKAKNDNNGK